MTMFLCITSSDKTFMNLLPPRTDDTPINSGLGLGARGWGLGLGARGQGLWARGWGPAPVIRQPGHGLRESTCQQITRRRDSVLQWQFCCGLRRLGQLCARVTLPDLEVLSVLQLNTDPVLRLPSPRGRGGAGRGSGRRVSMQSLLT